MRDDFPSYLGSRDNNAVSNVLWGILFGTLLVIGLGLLRGFVVMKLWGWFVTPTFESAPNLSIAVAWGIAMLVGFMVAEFPDHRDKGTFWASVLIAPFSTLLMGWIVSHWVI